MISKKIIEQDTRLKDLETRIHQLERQAGHIEAVQRKLQEVLNDEAQAMTQISEMMGKMSEKIKTGEMIQYRMIRIIEKYKELFEQMGYAVEIPREEPEAEPTLKPAPPDEAGESYE